MRKLLTLDVHDILDSNLFFLYPCWANQSQVHVSVLT